MKKLLALRVPERTLVAEPMSPMTPIPVAPLQKSKNTALTQSNAQTAINGYVGWVITVVIAVVYALWAFLPNEWLQSIGWTYLPDKYWAMAIPTILCSFWMTAYFTDTFWTHCAVPLLDSYQTLQDSHTCYLSENCFKRKQVDLTMGAADHDDDSDDDTVTPKIPLMRDIPIHQYNQIMYHNKKTQFREH